MAITINIADGTYTVNSCYTVCFDQQEVLDLPFSYREKEEEIYIWIEEN